MPKRLKALASKFDNAVRNFEPWGVLITLLGFVIGLIGFFLDFSDRFHQRRVSAWQLVNVQGTGNTGKTSALSYLNTRQGLCVPFDGPCLFILKERVPIVGLQFRPNEYLRSVRLSSARIHDTKFKSVNLGAADFSYAKISNTDLSSSYLEGADFSNSLIFASNLTGATLSGADFNGAKIRSGTTFADTYVGATQKKATIYFQCLEVPAAGSTEAQALEANKISSCPSFVSSHIYGFNIVADAGVDWTSTNFSNVKFFDQYWDTASMKGVTFENVRISNFKVRNAQLQTSRITETQFLNSEIMFPDMVGAEFRSVEFKQNTKLTSAKANHTLWVGVEASNFELTSSHIKNSFVIKSMFKNAKFEDIDISNSFMVEMSLNNSQLINSSLKNTVIANSNFEETKMANVDFSGACQFKSTGVPEVVPECTRERANQWRRKVSEWRETDWPNSDQSDSDTPKRQQPCVAFSNDC